MCTKEALYPGHKEKLDWFDSGGSLLWKHSGPFPLLLDSHSTLIPRSPPSENEELGASPGGHAKGLIFDSFQLPLKGLAFKSIKRLLGVEKLGQDYINL